MKIAYSSNELSELLIRKENQQVNQDILILQESEIEKLLVNGKIKIALVNPLMYGRIRQKKDVRILPINSLMLEDFTNILSLNISHNIKEHNKLKAIVENEYLICIAKILLAERYNIQVKEISSFEGSELKLNDSNATLDISEDWFESFKHLLPIYFWVVALDEDLLQIEEYHNLIKPLCYPNDEYIQSSDGLREGRIIRNWVSESEDSIDNTLDILFYHNYLENMMDSKIYNLEDILEEQQNKQE